MTLLEKLARGTFTDKRTLISEKFSKAFYEMISQKNCCRENGEISSEMLEKLLQSGEINIEYLIFKIKISCHKYQDIFNLASATQLLSLLVSGAQSPNFCFRFDKNDIRCHVYSLCI